jgi:hypothetical protein
MIFVKTEARTGARAPPRDALGAFNHAALHRA